MTVQRFASRRTDLHRRPGAAAWIIAALSLPAAAGSAVGQAATGPTQNAVAGAKVFGSKGCVQCHAIRGVGGRVGPDLGRIEERRSFFDLAAAMWNHLPDMRERMAEVGIESPRLSAQETGDLMAFLFTLDYFDDFGDVNRGRRLFAEKRCVMCHQVRGTGGVVGPNLDHLAQYSSPMFVAAAMWNHGPAMADRMREIGIVRPQFTGDEFRDLMAFFESVSAQPPQGPLHVLPGRANVGRELFIDKGCIRCHAVQGQGGRIGPTLGGRAVEWSTSDFVASMWNKAPSMQATMRAGGYAVPEMDGGEMSDLVAYLYSVNYFSEAGSPARGRRQLTLKGCLQCHALEGRGGDTAGDLSEGPSLATAAEVVSALWSHAPLAEPGPGREAGEWPEFTPAELADLAALLQSLRPPP